MSERSETSGKPIRCCEHLSSKTMDYDPDERPGLLREDDDCMVYMCLKSMTPVGPDNADAAPSLCNPARSCFEENVE